MRKTIEKLIEESIAVKEGILDNGAPIIEAAARAVIKSLKSGGKVLACGNGGSAADSQHIAAELVGRFKKERRAFAAIALTTDTSIITALANDYCYDAIFARQVSALGKKGDLLIGISTSGNSKNVIEAVKEARRIGMATICLTGSGGGKLRCECDIAIMVDSSDTARIQEAHILIEHIICHLVEDELSRE